MNSEIISLEKQKNDILRQRNEYKWNSDKEAEVFEPTLKRFDNELEQVVKRIKVEWNKLYKK